MDMDQSRRKAAEYRAREAAAATAAEAYAFRELAEHWERLAKEIERQALRRAD